jgi:murein DD-endopeptidase MepM/ murein hydrolase activator NlpD
VRDKGKPVRIEDSFPMLPSFQGPYKLIIRNGNSKATRVSSAVIRINGKQIIGGSDLNKNISRIEKTINLESHNTVLVAADLKSKPGSFLTIEIEGQRIATDPNVIQQAVGEIGPAGGEVQLEDVALVTLPEDATRPPLDLTVQEVESASSSSLYEGETTDAGPAHPRMIRIVSSENISAPVAIKMNVPPAFVSELPSGHRVELFAKVVQVGAHNEELVTFDPLGATFDALNLFAFAAIPPAAFAPTNSVETTVILGSTPNSPSRIVTGSNFVPAQHQNVRPFDFIEVGGNLAFSIPAPVGSPFLDDIPVVITSPFGLRTIDGQTRPHQGVDISSNHDFIAPVAPGRVIASGPQTGCPPSGFCQVGYGYRVKILHTDGTVSVYGHLEPGGLPPEGAEVGVDQIIGVSDTSGASDEPHLHLELWRDGLPLNPLDFVESTNEAAYLSSLSVVSQMNGRTIDGTHRVVDSANFNYSAAFDLVPLNLPNGSTSQLSIVLRGPNGQNRLLHTIPVTILAAPLRITLTWDKSTDVDLWVQDSLGRTSAYFELCGIPNGCLDRDDTDGFGPEVFTLREPAPGITYTVYIQHYNDYGLGPTNARVVVEQGETVVGPFVNLLSSGDVWTVGVFPQDPN